MKKKIHTKTLHIETKKQVDRKIVKCCGKKKIHIHIHSD